jgi:spore coat polysaccharide biosynthesis protein SpsF
VAVGARGIFVQVRLASSRLPRKALLPLGGSTVIEQVMAALARVPADVHALLTDADSAAELAEPARRSRYELFVGPAGDVLARFHQAALRYGVRTVVRATGDNPLVCPHLACAILEEHERLGPHLSHYIGCPLGTGVEVVTVEALAQAAERASDPEEREHMTTYLYRHRDAYRVHEPWVSEAWRHDETCVSVDTVEDHERVMHIYADLFRGHPIEALEVVRWLRSHPSDARRAVGP